MATRGLEARLTWRLAPVIALSLAVVAAVAIATTARALAASADSRARMLATASLRSFSEELAEQEVPGGTIEAAAHEVHEEIEGNEVHLDLTPSAVDLKAMPAGADSTPRFSGLDDLASGACSSFAQGPAHWRACAETALGRRALVAVRIDHDLSVVNRLAAGMAATFVLTLFAALFSARRALHQPLVDLGRLATWSEGIACVQDGRAPPPPPGETREIIQLTAALTSLVDALVETLARERANSAHIAHEMRTPLTALRADLDALGSESAEVAVRLRADVDRLVEVVDAVLVLSSPASASRGEIVNLADLVRAAAPPGTRVQAPDEALVEADGALLRLALANLLENARRYAPPGATLVRVERLGDAVRVAVVDAGPGIPAETRARAFDRYWRATNTKGGRGLGLALVRAVAQQHGGVADIRSTPSGIGIEVGFTVAPLVDWFSG